MGHKYNGPKIENLPLDLRDRVRNAAETAQKETADMAIVVGNWGAFFKGMTPDELWGRYKGFKEVFVFDYGSLIGAFFRRGDAIYKLFLSGMASQTEREKIEKALGLEVKVRPVDNQSDADMRIGNESLEKIAGLGKSPRLDKDKPFVYESSPSGPYMGRR